MTNFGIKNTIFDKAKIIIPFCVCDERGLFIKDFNDESLYKEGILFKIREVFHTVSYKGTIRALHFQEVNQQAKIVRCIKGKIFDVIVDLREDSSTFGQWQSFELSEENRLSLFVPKYFAHGYLVLEDSIVSYKCDEVFYGEYDTGIFYNDKDLNIPWPFDKVGGEDKLIISKKDKVLISFKNYFSKS